jgi:hypothetical protein
MVLLMSLAGVSVFLLVFVAVSALATLAGMALTVVLRDFPPTR